MTWLTILGLVLMGLALGMIVVVFILVASVGDEQHLPYREPTRGNNHRSDPQ